MEVFDWALELDTKSTIESFEQIGRLDPDIDKDQAQKKTRKKLDTFRLTTFLYPP